MDLVSHLNVCSVQALCLAPFSSSDPILLSAFRQPAVRQFLDIPQVAPPRPAPAAPVPASEGPKPVPAVDSPPAADGSGQSSSEPMEKNVYVEKKRRTPRVIINREQ